VSRTRAIIVISAAAAGAWLLPAVVHAVLVWLGPPPSVGPGPFGWLLPLVPETVPVWAWHSVAPWAFVLPLVSAVAFAAIVATAATITLDRMPSAAPRWRVAITVWALAIAAGIVVFGAHAVASLVDDAPFLRLQYVAERGGAAIAQGLIWGVLWGWITGVVASRIAPPGSSKPRSRPGLLAAAIIVAVLATSAVVFARPAATDANYAATGQHTTNGVQPAPTQPASTPTPPPLIAPGAGPGDPSWCTSAQLEFSDGGADAATGHRSAAIRAQNVGEDACILDGYPDLAFADDLGDEVAVTVASGGGFMTEDPGPVAFELQPGATAVTYAAWDATDGRTSLTAVYVAPYAGAERVVITVVHPWDLTEATMLTVTAWQAEPAIDPFSE
jgi:hypothetical protein